MWEEILKVALGNGLWAVLFCVLLMYQLRDGRSRESKYRDMISALVDRLGVLDEVRQTVNETLDAVRRKERKKERAEENARRACVLSEGGRGGV